MSYTWLPSTLRRILEPFLGNCDASVREAVEQAMEKIRRDPYDPDLPHWPWKGIDFSNAFVAIAEGRIVIRYQIMQDYPLLALINVLDFSPRR